MKESIVGFMKIYSVAFSMSMDNNASFGILAKILKKGKSSTSKKFVESGFLIRKHYSDENKACFLQSSSDSGLASKFDETIVND